MYNVHVLRQLFTLFKNVGTLSFPGFTGCVQESQTQPYMFVSSLQLCMDSLLFTQNSPGIYILTFDVCVHHYPRWRYVGWLSGRLVRHGTFIVNSIWHLWALFSFASKISWISQYQSCNLMKYGLVQLWREIKFLHYNNYRIFMC